MTQSLPLILGRELAYQRQVEFAIELLDAVTLERVTAGVKVTAEGLHGKPIVNASGVFVWLKEDRATLRKLVIEPQQLPYARRELDPAMVAPLLTTVYLEPAADYAFPSGLTALRGTLIEAQVSAPNTPDPVAGAEISLRWLDDDGTTWRDSPITSRTNARGDFATALRLAPQDVPRVQNGDVTVRVRVRRAGLAVRESADLSLRQGRTAERAAFAQGPSALTFAWDDLQL